MDINEVLYLDEYYDFKTKCALYQTDTILEMGILQESILCESKIDIKKIIENFINFINNLIDKIKAFFKKIDKSLYDMSISDKNFYKKIESEFSNIISVYKDDLNIKLDDEIILYKPNANMFHYTLLGSSQMDCFLADEVLNRAINIYLCKGRDIYAFIEDIKNGNTRDYDEILNNMHDYDNKDNIIKKLKEVTKSTGNDYNEIMCNHIHESKCEKEIYKEINKDVVNIVNKYYTTGESEYFVDGMNSEKKTYLFILDKINKQLEKLKQKDAGNITEEDIIHLSKLTSIFSKVISVETALYNTYYQEFFNAIAEYGKGMRKLAILAVTRSKKLKSELK